MKALISIVSGPYFDGLKDNGYTGSSTVRPPRVEPNPITIGLPPSAPGVSQSTAVGDFVTKYVDWLVRNDKVDDVDDNHELFMVVFLDPSVPVPVDLDTSGNTTFVTGGNAPYKHFEALDDDTRFQMAWISTTSLELADVTRTLSHELVEGISDPFKSGWTQASPPAANGGQIADVCNQPGIVDGVAVNAYWSQTTGACIIPTAGKRSVSLTYSLDTHEPHDRPSQTGYEDFPIICGGGQYFTYKVRTYRNQVTVHFNMTGYESPACSLTINGQPVPFGMGHLDVEAEWDEPPSNPHFPDFIHPGAFKARLNTWLPSTAGPDVTIYVGPDQGNVSLEVVATVRESFDDPSEGGGSTLRTARLDFDVPNMEIVWDSLHGAAMRNCRRMTGLSDDLAIVVGPPRPGDPPDLVEILTKAVGDRTEQRSEALRRAAARIQDARPEIAESLNGLAQRAAARDHAGAPPLGPRAHGPGR